MTTPDAPFLSYTCPRCQTPLTASAQDAGKRRDCPSCGKAVKVPGVPTTRRSPSKPPTPPPIPPAQSGGPATTHNRPTPPEPPPPKLDGEGIGQVTFTCPYCDTRLDAQKNEAGSKIVCPDCLESVVVPQPKSIAPVLRPKTAESPTADATRESDSDDDYELRLSDPIEIPTNKRLPQSLADMIAGTTAPPASPPLVDLELVQKPGSPSAAARAPAVFSVKCPVCDTLLHATDAEIGRTKKCPDCLSAIEIKRPAPKPRRTFAVDDNAYKDDVIELSAPVELDVYKRSLDGASAKSMGEQSLRNAEREYDERKALENELPGSPLLVGVLRFLPDPAVIFRILVIAVLAAATASLAQTSVDLARQGGAAAFMGMVGIVGVFSMSAVASSIIGVTALTIIQETASGHDRIPEWPEFNLFDWFVESLNVFMGLFFSMAPGMMIGWLAGCSGKTFWLVTGVSVYALFPVVQLSILESASLATVISGPILKSLREETGLWITLYLFTGALAVAVAFSAVKLSADTPFLVLLLLSVFWTLVLLLIFRLLGRLAWACHVRPLQPDRDTVDEEE